MKSGKGEIEELTEEEQEIIEENLEEGRKKIQQYIYEMNNKPPIHKPSE